MDRAFDVMLASSMGMALVGRKRARLLAFKSAQMLAKLVAEADNLALDGVDELRGRCSIETVE